MSSPSLRPEHPCNDARDLPDLLVRSVPHANSTRRRILGERDERKSFVVEAVGVELDVVFDKVKVPGETENEEEDRERESDQEERHEIVGFSGDVARFLAKFFRGVAQALCGMKSVHEVNALKC